MAGATPADYVMKPDARRFEYGNANHLGAYLLQESLTYLESFGIEAIAAHVRAFAERLIAGLSGAGVEVLTPAGQDRPAGKVCFRLADTGAALGRAAYAAFPVWWGTSRGRAPGP